MEIRKHVLSSGWISGSAVSQTYGRNYQRKMEITSGLGLIRGPVQSCCICAVRGLGPGVQHLQALPSQLLQEPARPLLPSTWQQLCPQLPSDTAGFELLVLSSWQLLALPIPALC